MNKTILKKKRYSKKWQPQLEIKELQKWIICDGIHLNKRGLLLKKLIKDLGRIQMKKIRFLLEYGCYPMWIYDEKGEILDNDLVEDLSSEEEIDVKLLEIQRIYESLFVNDAKSFGYIGFTDVSERNAFIDNIEYVIFLLKEKLEGKYIIVNDININGFYEKSR